jgi:hypothetical protein
VAIENIVSKLDNQLPPALAGGLEIKKKNFGFSQNLQTSTFRLKSKRNLSLIIHRLKPVAIENIVSKLDNQLPPALAGG